VRAGGKRERTRTDLGDDPQDVGTEIDVLVGQIHSTMDHDLDYQRTSMSYPKKERKKKKRRISESSVSTEIPESKTILLDLLQTSLSSSSVSKCFLHSLTLFSLTQDSPELTVQVESVVLVVAVEADLFLVLGRGRSALDAAALEGAG
jgi:hypothetical protein